MMSDIAMCFLKLERGGGESGDLAAPRKTLFHVLKPIYQNTRKVIAP
jgi:hypothetical protein